MRCTHCIAKLLLQNANSLTTVRQTILTERHKDHGPRIRLNEYQRVQMLNFRSCLSGNFCIGYLYLYYYLNSNEGGFIVSAKSSRGIWCVRLVSLYGRQVPWVTSTTYWRLVKLSEYYRGEIAWERTENRAPNFPIFIIHLETPSQLTRTTQSAEDSSATKGPLEGLPSETSILCRIKVKQWPQEIIKMVI